MATLYGNQLQPCTRTQKGRYLWTWHDVFAHTNPECAAFGERHRAELTASQPAIGLDPRESRPPPFDPYIARSALSASAVLSLPWILLCAYLRPSASPRQIHGLTLRGAGTITCTNRRKGCPKIEAR